MVKRLKAIQQFIWRKKTYTICDLYNDGLVIVNELISDKRKDSLGYQIAYNLLYNTDDTINILSDFFANSINSKNQHSSINTVFSRVDTLISDSPDKVALRIYKSMSENDSFMQNIKNYILNNDSDSVEDILFSSVEYAIFSGRQDYALNLFTPVISHLLKIGTDIEDISGDWGNVFSLINSDEKEIYIERFTAFKDAFNKISHPEFFEEFLEELENYDSNIDADTQLQLGKIIELVNIDAEQAVSQWISLVQQHENQLQEEQNDEDSECLWTYTLFGLFSTKLSNRYGNKRGFIKMSKCFMNHEEWFKYMIYDDPTITVCFNLAELWCNKKYESKIKSILKIIHDYSDAESWQEALELCPDYSLPYVIIDKEALATASFSDKRMQAYSEYVSSL